MKRISSFVMALALMCAFIIPVFPQNAFADEHTAKTLNPETVKLFFNNSKNSVTDVYTSSKGTKLP